MSKTSANKTFSNPKDQLKLIGNTLKRIRESHSISIGMAAKSLRISKNRLEAIENGTTNYNLTLLVKICDYYNVNILDVVD